MELVKESFRWVRDVLIRGRFKCRRDGRACLLGGCRFSLVVEGMGDVD